MRRLLLTLAATTLVLVASAQDLKINVTKPGTLSALVGDRLNVEKLVVSGTLNDNDLRFIRSMENLREMNMRKLKNKQFGDSAFFGMKSLERIWLPRKLAVLGKSTFEGCEKLSAVEFPTQLQAIPDYMLKDCPSIDKVYIHNTHIRHIGKGAFMNSGLRLISLSTELRTIDAMAFANCARLEVINIPQWVMEIGSLAFANCGMLRGIIISTENPPICAMDAFQGLKECRLSVKHPEFYRDRLPWSRIDLDYQEYNGEELRTNM